MYYYEMNYDVIYYYVMTYNGVLHHYMMYDTKQWFLRYVYALLARCSRSKRYSLT